MKIHLVRIAVQEQGAFGVLLKDGYPFAVTIEHTYEQKELKIPEGETVCRRSVYHRGDYETYEIEVAGHSRILFHRGNWESDLDGCVAVGRSFGSLNGHKAILDSRGGFKEFMRVTNDEAAFDLRVSRALA